MGANQGSLHNCKIEGDSLRSVARRLISDLISHFRVMPVRNDWRDAMPLDDLSETLKNLAIKVYLVQLRLSEEQRVRELVNELKSLLDVGKATDPKPIL
jgi:hypothetical protein